MKQDFHVDMSGLLCEQGNSGIACFGSDTREHNGCALSGRIKRHIEKTLFITTKARENYAKIYAICIYFLIRDKLDNIKTLIICKDEDPIYVKESLHFLLEDKASKVNMMSLADFSKTLGGRKIGSPADNAANAYRKRALKKNRWHIGIPINVVEVTYTMVKDKWELLNKH